MADITITPASVVAGTGAQYADGTAGATIAAGDVLYLDSSVNKYKLADANGVGTTTVAGIALHASADGQPIRMQTVGEITIGGTTVAAETYVLSATPGKIAPVGDMATGMTLVHLGYGKSATVLVIKITNTGIVK